MAAQSKPALSLRRSIPRFIFWDGVLAAAVVLVMGAVNPLPPTWLANPVGLIFGFVSLVLCRAFLFTLLALGTERMVHRLRPHMQRFIMYAGAYFLPQVLAALALLYVTVGGSGTIRHVNWADFLNVGFIVKTPALWLVLHAPQMLAAVLTEFTEPLPRLRADGTLGLAQGRSQA